MIPESEIEALKRTVDLAALVRGRGISLKPKGKDLVGLCPFHADSAPSLVVTPAKNLFHCFSCGAGGDPIEFIMKLENVDFPEAVRRLQTEARITDTPAPPLARPEIIAHADAELLSHVVDHYQRTLKNNSNALRYLAGRGLASAEAFQKFRIGFCDGKIGSILPSSQRNEGASARNFLRSYGILRQTGYEHFEGSVTFPLFDEKGILCGMYGRRISHK
ncbi:MAG TPA: CHC2 zinc finger domain-containing protein, partial [Leptospiraceae bacterium]|nr:CHC2 zinc finger domain-containing protein [Leptospiraceae bacterium]